MWDGCRRSTLDEIRLLIRLISSLHPHLRDQNVDDEGRTNFRKKEGAFCSQHPLVHPILPERTDTQTATAVAHTKEGRGLIHINGSPITNLRPEILRFKVYEAVLAAGEENFAYIDIRLRVKGGGHTSQVYALRQAISKAVVAYHAKYIDASSALDLKKKLVAYDRSLLIADPRRAEPKKFGGRGARARRQKRLVQSLLSIEPLFDPLAPQLPLICLAAALYVFSIIVCLCHEQHDLHKNNRISRARDKTSTRKSAHVTCVIASRHIVQLWHKREPLLCLETDGSISGQLRRRFCFCPSLSMPSGVLTRFFDNRADGERGVLSTRRLEF